MLEVKGRVEVGGMRREEEGGGQKGRKVWG